MREEIEDFLEYQAPLSQYEMDGVIVIAEKFAVGFGHFIQGCFLDSSGKYLGKTIEELLIMYKEKLNGN